MTSTEPIRLSSLVSPSFYGVHRAVKAGGVSELWAKGGRGSTKSSYFSILVFLLLSADANAHALVSRRYDSELRDSVFGQMQWAADKLGISHLWRFMVSPMQAVNNITGQRIIFRGVDNPLRAKSINLGKGYLKIFWAEEVDQYGGAEEIRSILQSVFRGEEGGRLALFSFNPPKSARSWVNAEVKLPKPGRLVHHSDYLSVPVEWLGERFIADAKHLETVNPMAYRHEYLGEEVGTGLEVFGNVKIEPIMDQQISEFQSIRQGLDFGYAIDPVYFGRMNYNRKKRTLHIFREVSGIGIGNRALDGLITDQERRTHTNADSAEPKSIDELKLDYRWNIKASKKGPGSVEHGIKWLSELEAIIIDPTRCPLAASEFVNYALEVNARGDTISRYPDKDNHSIDATRYACVDDIYEVSVPASNVRARARI